MIIHFTYKCVGLLPLLVVCVCVCVRVCNRNCAEWINTCPRTKRMIAGQPAIQHMHTAIDVDGHAKLSTSQPMCIAIRQHRPMHTQFIGSILKWSGGTFFPIGPYSTSNAFGILLVTLTPQTFCSQSVISNELENKCGRKNPKTGKK